MRLLWIAGALGWCASAFCATPLIKHDFENSTSGWVAFGSPSTRVALTRDPTFVKNGTGALLLSYDASAKQPSVAVLPTPQGLERLKSVRCFLLADNASAIAFTISERKGGRYVAIVWLEPHVWQRVELTPEDFLLAHGPKDPEDPDGKLDLDQAEAFAIFDLSPILAGVAAEAGAPLAIERHSGTHQIAIDDFEVSADAPAWYKARAPLLIDDFASPQTSWFTLGGADLHLDTTGKVINGNALKIDYQILEGRYPIVTRRLPKLDLRGASQLAFDIASDRAVQIVISLEEWAPGKERGPHYTVNFGVPGGGKSEHRQIAPGEWEWDDDSPEDSDGKLDWDQIKSISILDVTNAFTGQTGVNTLRVGRIEGVKPAP